MLPPALLAHGDQKHRGRGRGSWRGRDIGAQSTAPAGLLSLTGQPPGDTQQKVGWRVPCREASAAVAGAVAGLLRGAGAMGPGLWDTGKSHAPGPASQACGWVHLLQEATNPSWGEPHSPAVKELSPGGARLFPQAATQRHHTMPAPGHPDLGSRLLPVECPGANCSALGVMG